jgi:hypothetical protein
MARIIQANWNTPNPDDLIPTEPQMNAMQGQIFDFDEPMTSVNFQERLATTATALSESNPQFIFSTFRSASTSLFKRETQLPTWMQLIGLFE